MMARLWEASGEGEADITTCGMAVVNKRGKLLYNASLEENSHRNDDNEVDIFNLLKPSFCNKIVRKSLFTSNGISFPEHMYYEDLATTPRLVHYARDIRVITDPLYCYVRHDLSITNSSSPRHIMDYFKAFDILSDFLAANNLTERYRCELEKLLGDSLHYHTRYLNRSGAPEETSAQVMRHMILMKLAYLEYNQKLLTADPKTFPDILLKATSRTGLESLLAADLTPPLPTN